MNPNTIEITILADGTIRCETGKISAAAHMNAETFLREMSRLAGGTVTVRKKHGIQQQQQTQQKHVQQ